MTAFASACSLAAARSEQQECSLRLALAESRAGRYADAVADSDFRVRFSHHVPPLLFSHLILLILCVPLTPVTSVPKKEWNRVLPVGDVADGSFSLIFFRPSP